MESKWTVMSTYCLTKSSLFRNGCVHRSIEFRSCKQLCTAKTTLKTWFRTFPLNIIMCQNLADTALAATSNCPAPNTLIKYVRFSNVSAQSWFHVGKEKKKIKTKNIRTRTSHSPTSQMQTPMSSEEAAHTPIHLLSITVMDAAVIMDEMVEE